MFPGLDGRVRLGQARSERGDAVRIEESRRGDCIVVGLHGHLSLEQAPEVRGVLLKDLGEQPGAVICDLSGLEAIEPTCAGLFLSVANEDDSGWPSTAFLLAGAGPAVASVLHSLRVHDFLPLCDSVDEAFVRAVQRPPYLRDQIHLSLDPAAVAAARLFTRDVWARWRLTGSGPASWEPAEPGGLPPLERVLVVVSELVTNAVVHAPGTDLWLRIELRGDRLWVKVRDGMPRLLTLRRRGDWLDGGRGLVLVDALSSSWGVGPDLTGGKVVWASFSLKD
jgi:anti-anti-sigma regulatory factor